MRARRGAAVSESLSTAAPVKSPKTIATKKKAAESSQKAEKPQKVEPAKSQKAEPAKSQKAEPVKSQKAAKRSTGAATIAKSPSASMSKSEKAPLKVAPAPVLQSQKKTSKPSRPALVPEAPGITRPAQVPPMPPKSNVQVPGENATPRDATMEERWRSGVSPKTSRAAHEKEFEARKKSIARRYMAILVSLPILIVTSYYLFVDRRK
jgi:hypothetical protein